MLNDGVVTATSADMFGVTMNQFDLLKSHIDAYTRKDGVVVQSHEDNRTKHTPASVQDHAVAAGAKYKTSVFAFSSADKAHSFADRAHGSKGGAFVMNHPDHGYHVVVGGADAQRMEKNGYRFARPRKTNEQATR